MSPGRGSPPRRAVLGMSARRKPSLAASFSRTASWLTARSSPLSPTSPTTARSAGSGRSFTLEAIASAMARSAAGSATFSPPITLTNTSCSERRIPARRVSTAVSSSRRLKSTPLAVRRGLAKLVVVASACTSASSGRVPSMVITIAEPGASTSRSARNASEGLSTSTMPPPCISKTPTSEVAPKRFFTLRSRRKAWKASPSR